MALRDPIALELVGSAEPRIAPPRPLRHDLSAYRDEAIALGITPMPWQETATVYITATDADKLWLYREVACVVGRQNGKTTLVKPIILKRLKAGRHIMHIAQVRDLPREMFEELADVLEATDPGLFPRRRGKIIWPRRGAGSESIKLTNGGSYRIAAALSGSARGRDSIDDLIIDELREADSFAVVNAAKPAQRFAENPQTIYLSNAGTDKSVVLNSLRDRAADDPSLAYLEWSAHPDYASHDRRGWVQANPAIGHFPQVLRDLETDYVAAELGGNLAGFETEALCRWVNTILPPIILPATWEELRGEFETVTRPCLGIALDPNGQRASAVLCWQQDDGGVAVRAMLEGTGDPMNVAAFGEDVKRMAREAHVSKVGFDGSTDAELAKYFKKPDKVSGPAWTNASSRFVNLVESGKLVWDSADVVGPDIPWTGRKTHQMPGTWTAIPTSDEHPPTAMLATIRAVWLASGPKPQRPKVH